MAAMAADRLAALAAWRRSSLQWLCVGAVLAILAVEVGRSQAQTPGVAAVLLGSAPSFLAALALPGGILLHRTRIQARLPALMPGRLWAVATLVSQAALIAWEFMQLRIPTMSFDSADLAATVLGGLVWTALCLARPQAAEISD